VLFALVLVAVGVIAYLTGGVNNVGDNVGIDDADNLVSEDMDDELYEGFMGDPTTATYTEYKLFGYDC